MDIVTQAKNIGAVLGTASVLGYISGYLALRARAHALGTDPAFSLVDEAYVFAGFRFLFITLVVLLLSAPAILLIRWGGLRLARHASDAIVQYAQWPLLLILAVVTLMTFKLLTVSGVLLQPSAHREAGSALYRAVLGEETTLRLALTFATVVLAALSLLWLQARFSSGRGPFEWVLGVVVALQTIMLPIYHGALFADRKVRVLAAIPTTVTGLVAPLGIVDRTSEHASLLGLDEDGNSRITTIKLEDLNGISIERILSLKDFVGATRGSESKRGTKEPAGLATSYVTQIADATGQANGEPVMASRERDVKLGFFATLVDYLQITLEAIGSLADGEVQSGELWAVDLDASGMASNPRRIGSLDDIAWPVVGPGDSTFYALQRGRVVRLSGDGRSVEILDDTPRWRRLIGVAEEGSLLGLLLDGGETKPAVMAPDGNVQVDSSPLSDEDKKNVAILMQETRSYAGGRVLSADRSARGGRGFDVVLTTGEKAVNMSDCGDDACGQASLAPDFRTAVFVRQPRY